MNGWVMLAIIIGAGVVLLAAAGVSYAVLTRALDKPRGRAARRGTHPAKGGRR